MISKKELEKELLSGTILNYGSHWDKPQIAFDIMPVDFLKYAEADILSKDKGSLVNALSNTKRALDCQIEIIICDHGLKKKLKKKRWNLPKKINFLREKYIVAPRVLEKINKTRNMLEHEFKKPSIDKVEDALDIVTLFIGYSKQLKRVPDYIHLGVDEKTTEYVKIFFDKENFVFEIIDDPGKLFSITEKDQSFERLLNLFYGIHPATYTLMHRSEFTQENY
jgi:hypothetical protein